MYGLTTMPSLPPGKTGRLIGRFTSVWADGVADKTADEVQQEMRRAIEENV